MTFLVAIAPDDVEQGAVALGVDLAIATGEDLRVVTVIGRQSAAAGTAGEQQYRQFFTSQADQALAAASQNMPEQVTASFDTVVNRSTAGGLFAEADSVGARAIVLGSARDGQYGRVGIGSVSDRLLHSSPHPLAIAPRGLRVSTRPGVSRLSVAYAGRKDDVLLQGAAREAASMGASLRVLTFAVRPTLPVYSAGLMGEDAVIDSWLHDVKEQADAVIAQAGIAAQVTGVRGPTWADALSFVDWESGETIVVGSSRGIFERVFIGSRAAKILRCSPVSVIALPRAAQRLRAE